YGPPTASPSIRNNRRIRRRGRPAPPGHTARRIRNSRDMSRPPPFANIADSARGSSQFATVPAGRRKGLWHRGVRAGRCQGLFSIFLSGLLGDFDLPDAEQRVTGSFKAQGPDEVAKLPVP